MRCQQTRRANGLHGARIQGLGLRRKREKRSQKDEGETTNSQKNPMPTAVALMVQVYHAACIDSTLRHFGTFLAIVWREGENSRMPEKDSRCWPGYEPVPGKPEHSQGSCREKAESKSTPSDKKAQGARAKQLTAWQKEHPGKSKSAAQHLHAPGTKTKAAAKKKTAASK